jgi:hypothetical protein
MQRSVASTQQVICPDAFFTTPSYTAIFYQQNASKAPLTLLHTSSTTKYARFGIM